MYIILGILFCLSIFLCLLVSSNYYDLHKDCMSVLKLCDNLMKTNEELMKINKEIIEIWKENN